MTKLHNENLWIGPPSLLARLVRNKKRVLHRQGSVKDTAAEKLNRKRFAKKLVRKWYRKWRKNRPVYEQLRGIPPAILLRRYKANGVADVLVPERKDAWIPIRRRTREVATIDVRAFSFIHNPDATCEVLKQIVRCEADKLSVQVNFLDEFVYDLAPYLVLAELWSSLAPVYIGGKISKPVQKVLDAVGLRTSLQMKPFRQTPQGAAMWALPMQRRVPFGEPMSVDRMLGPQKREKVADDFCEWIDRCLGVSAINKQLTDYGKSQIASLIGELLDNAERHSSEDGDGMWSVSGFMFKSGSKEKPTFALSIAILSIGKSISESLNSAGTAIKTRLDDYTSQHRKIGVSAETLRTVVALQDYVTRVERASLEQRGGVGLQDVFEFADELGGSPEASKRPQITVISGQSCIHLRGNYVKGQRTEDAGRPREVWFNAANSPNYTPERTHVYDLTSHFPGTLISMLINLNPDILQVSVNE